MQCKTQLMHYNDGQDQNRERFSVKCGKSSTAFCGYLAHFIVNPPRRVYVGILAEINTDGTINDVVCGENDDELRGVSGGFVGIFGHGALGYVF